MAQNFTGKILIVDDDIDSLNVLLEMVNSSGFHTLVATDGESAIEKIKTNIPDLILLDVMMPGIDGFETCRLIKENIAFKDIPVIFLTALSETINKVKGFEAGGIDYITKPYQNEEVIIRINTHLKNYKLQKQLKESESRYRSLMELSPYSVFICRDDKIDLLNSAAIKLLGADNAEQIREKSLYDFFHPDFHTVTAERIKKILTGESVPSVENKIVRLDSSIRDVEVMGSSITDSGGPAVQMILQDITERKKNEKILQDSEERYRVLVESSPDAIIIHQDGWIRFANNSAISFFGAVSFEHLSSKNLLDFIHHLERDISFERIKRAMEGQKIPMREATMTRFDGREVISEITSSPIIYQGSRAIQTIIRDITERRIAEDSLKINLTKYKVLFESFPLGISVTDKEGNIIESNLIANQLMGLSKEEHEKRNIRGKEWKILRPDGSIMPEDEYVSVNALVNNCLIENAEMGIVSNDGIITWLNVTAAPIPLQGYGVATAYNDITLRKQIEMDLLESEKRYRSLFNGMTEGFALHEIVCNENGEPSDYIFIDINPAFEKLTGLKREKVIGKPVSIVIPDNEHYWVEIYGKVALTGEPAQFENYSSPLKKYFEVFAYSPFPKQFAVLFMDITEKKQIENTLRENEYKLKQYAEFLEHTPVMIRDINDKIIIWNSGMEKLYGIFREDAIGKIFHELLKTTPKQDLSEIKSYLFKNGRWEGELRHTNKEGSQLVVTSLWVLHKDENDKPVAVIEVDNDITGRITAEELLRESEERYRSLVETSPYGIIVQRNGRFIYANSIALRLYQAETLDELQTKTVLDLIHPEDRSSLNSILNSGQVEQKISLHELRLLGLDGRITHVETTGSLIDYKGESATQIIIHNITERKKNEEVKNKLNRTLKALNKSNHAMMHAVDENTYLSEVCRIIVRDCGHTMVWIGYAEEDVAKTVRPVAFAGLDESYLKTLNITWSDTERGKGPTGTAVRTGKITGCKNMNTDPAFEPWREEALKRGFGSSIVFPLRTHGKTFGAITIYSKETDAFSDDEADMLTELSNDLAYGITAIRARIAREQAERALKESEKRFHIIIRNSPLIFFLQDIYLRYKWIYNPNENISIRSMVGKTDWEIHTEEETKFLTEQKETVMKTGKGLRTEFKVKYGGNEFIYAMTLEPHRDSEDNIIGIYGVGFDITNQKLAEEILKRDKETFERLVSERTQELLNAQVELEKSKRLSDVGMLAATVAHELRNPLAAIQMASVNIKRKAKNQDLDRHVQNIEKKIVESSQIINNLLYYTKIRAPHYESVKIHEIIQECINESQKQLKKNLTINNNSGTIKNLSIDADPLQIKEIFTNILNNAIDAVPDSKGKIEIKTKEYENSIEISIKDNGIGINKDNLENIFNPFFSTKAKGTGLGLSVCQQLVNLHSGTITIESELNKGAVVKISLPKKKNSEP